MTNFERYEKEVKECKYDFALVDGKIISEDVAYCKNCKFYEGVEKNCILGKIKWLYEDYQETETDWSKVAVDTPILVRNDKEEVWERRHFAAYVNGYVWAWENKGTSWTRRGKYMTQWNHAKLAEGSEK